MPAEYAEFEAVWYLKINIVAGFVCCVLAARQRRGILISDSSGSFNHSGPNSTEKGEKP